MAEKKSFVKYPHFAYLLPVFFIIHVYAEYADLSPARYALYLLAIYLGGGFILFGLFWLWFRNVTKACLVTFLFQAINFFFGTVHDFLKHFFHGTLVVKYSVLLPLIVLLMAAIVFFIKKSSHRFVRLTLYLNAVLLLLIIFDLFQITSNRTPAYESKKQIENQLKPCDTCSKPDIYLIIADEYAGRQELHDLFSFDNSNFENELAHRGFQVLNNTTSNYNYTVYSMASLFDMDYNRELREDTVNEADVTLSRGIIKNNIVVDFLRNNGYEFHNLSFLDINGEPKAVRSLYFPSRRLFTARTLLGRVYHDLWFHFASDEEIEGLRRNNMYNNRIIDSLTRDLAGKKSAKPKFIYTHLIMPHHPYFFDSAGHLTNDSLLFDSYKLNRNAYIGYLQYSNNKFLSLIDYIKEKSQKPPVIMLMSDHGFHEFSEDVDKKYHFMNLDAIFAPSGNYNGFYDGMTPVNQFRVLFNGIFQQRLPLLKDSSVFLWESKLPVIMD